MAKVMEIGWQQTKLLQQLTGLLFLAHPVYAFSFYFTDPFSVTLSMLETNRGIIQPSVAPSHS